MNFQAWTKQLRYTRVPGMHWSNMTPSCILLCFSHIALVSLLNHKYPWRQSINEAKFCTYPGGYNLSFYMLPYTSLSYMPSLQIKRHCAFIMDYCSPHAMQLSEIMQWFILKYYRNLYQPFQMRSLPRVKITKCLTRFLITWSTFYLYRKRACLYLITTNYDYLMIKIFYKNPTY